MRGPAGRRSLLQLAIEKTHVELELRGVTFKILTLRRLLMLKEQAMHFPEPALRARCLRRLPPPVLALGRRHWVVPVDKGTIAC